MTTRLQARQQDPGWLLQPHQGGPKELVSFRFPPSLVAWLRERARGDHVTVSHLVVLALEDLRSYFGLPATVGEVLDADRAALGLSVREYLMHVLLRRHEEVRVHGPGFDGPRRRSEGRGKGAGRDAR